MRKLLIILILFLSKLSYGQFPNGVSQDNSKTIRQFNGAIKALKGFIPPTLDTLNNPASTYYGALTTSPLYPGKLFMSIQTKWIEVSGGSSGLSFPAVVHKYLTGYDNVFGTLNTDSITEATNLFYTTARARLAVSSLSPLVYNNTTGVFSADTTILATQTDITDAISAIPVKWNVLGNSAITSANWIGTINNATFRFRTNNAERMKLDSVGTLTLNGFATTTPYTLISFRSIEDPTNPVFNMFSNGTDASILIKPNNNAFSSDGSSSGYGPLKLSGSYIDSIQSLGQYKGMMFKTQQGFEFTLGASASTPALLFLVDSNHVPKLTIKNTRGAGVYLGDTTNIASAKFIVTTTTQGVLFPRWSTAQMNAISSPATSLLGFNNDSLAFFYWNGAGWTKIGTGGSTGPITGVTSVATGYGLSGGTITASGTLLWDSAAAYITALRRKDSVNTATAGYTTLYQNSLKQNALTVTNVGTGGAATLVGPTLNIPIYAGGSPNVNVGSGYRLTFPGNNNVRTLFNRFGLLLDSTTNTNGISLYADSAFIATKFRLQQSINDSLTANSFTIAHAAQAAGYDSLIYIIDATHIKFVKLTGGASPIVLTQASDTSIGFSIPSFIPASGKTLTVSNTMTLAGTDGSVMTFNNVDQQTISTAITWSGTAPTGTSTNTYRWTRIGKHITARFNLAYLNPSAGTSSQVSIVLPIDMPTPEKPTGFSTANDYTTVGEGMLSTTKNSVSSERGRSFIQWDGTNYNIIIKITTASAVQWGYAVIDYWTP